MRKSAILLLALLSPGCKSSDINDPAVTTTVVVSSNPTQIAVGETAQASAIVRDQNGNTLSGKDIAWESLNPSVATVTQQGLIRGIAPGTATIRGTVDGVTGDAAIQVVALTAACSNGGVDVDLAVGQVRVVNVIDATGCAKLVGTTQESSYLVIAANTNPIPDAFPSFALRVDPGETAPSGTLMTGAARVMSSLAVPDIPASVSLQSGFEAALRASERRSLDMRSAQAAFARGTLPQMSSVTAAAVPAVGEKTDFRVPKTGVSNACTNFTTIKATARHISTRAIIYTDDASPAGGFTDADFQEIAREFDALIYPTDVDYFGTPLDLDANSRIVILYTPEVNRLTPAGNPTGFVGGFFFAGDLFPTASCPQSNRAELFYVLTADPAGTINGNARTVAQVRQGTRGTIAHEFVHMINASERIRRNTASEFESIWLDEALAHYAEDLNGRVLKGLSETGNYTFEQLAGTTQATFNDYAAFFFQNFARTMHYFRNPPPNSPTSATVDTSLAGRGAAWALLRYTADHYAPGGDTKAMLRALSAGPDTGVINLRSKAGNVPFDSLVAGWLVANYADDADIPNLAGKYTYRTYNMRSNTARVNEPARDFPLLVTTLPQTSSTTQLQVRSGSGAYFRISRPGGAPSRFIRMVNSGTNITATFGGATLIVLRVP